MTAVNQNAYLYQSLENVHQQALSGKLNSESKVSQIKERQVEASYEKAKTQTEEYISSNSERISLLDKKLSKIQKFAGFNGEELNESIADVQSSKEFSQVMDNDKDDLVSQLETAANLIQKLHNKYTALNIKYGKAFNELYEKAEMGDRFQAFLLSNPTKFEEAQFLLHIVEQPLETIDESDEEDALSIASSTDVETPRSNESRSPYPTSSENSPRAFSGKDRPSPLRSS